MKQQYIQFLEEQSVRGSNKTNSYIRALDLLGPILYSRSKYNIESNEIWTIKSVSFISELYNYIKEQQKLFKRDQGIFVGLKPASYWKNGFCSAALKSYEEFLILTPFEKNMWNIVNEPKTDLTELSLRLQDQMLDSAERLVEEDHIEMSTKEGKEALREVKTRVNQSFFRKMILKYYSKQCCITGLNIPEVLRASHIVSWAEDPKNRLNPSNGLCLSATYDAAFDRHLISLDKDYRMILGPSLKEYFSNQAFKEQFQKIEGCRIILPNRFAPDKVLLEKHRNKTFK